MDFKILGSILLIVGTSIGAGMLALPIATAQLGFIGSLILLFSCWFVMTAGAFLMLEVNLWMPLNSNLISMARETIGPFGQLISWIAYLLLLYSLLCAYIAGGSDLFHNLLAKANIDVSAQISAVVFTLIFGGIVYLGIRCVDYVNRGLMFFKFGAYFLLIILLTPLVSSVKLAAGNLQHLTSIAAITVTITSFGYAAIIPSLRIYFNGDVKKLKKAIIFGSLVPLICYIAWDIVIMGVIPLDGDHGLIAILKSPNSTSDLLNALTSTANENSVTIFAKIFTSICVLTSFLGVALCMVDFLADGLHLEKSGPSNIFLHLLGLLPPLVLVLFFPGVFVKALEYAGIYCVILLVLLPAWMAWQGRYRRQIANGFTVPGGKILLAGLIILSLVMIIKALMG